MSRRSSYSTASAITRCCPAASRTSTSSARIIRPSPSTRLTASARSSGCAGGYPLCSVTGAHASIATMSAPARANRMQCERPWPRAAPVTYATLPARGSSSAMVDVVRVMDDVMQVIDRDRLDGEFAAVAAQAAPCPPVGGHISVGVGHNACGVEQFGSDRGRVLGCVVVGDRGFVLVPVGELRFILVQHQPHPVVEDSVHVADMAAVFQRGPHGGSTALLGSGLAKSAYPVACVSADPVSDLRVMHRRGVEAALGTRAAQDPGPILGVGFDGLRSHGISVAATSRIRSPAPDAMGSPWPKQAVSASSAANRRNDATVFDRSWLNVPSMTVPTLAMVSLANSTLWRGR